MSWLVCFEKKNLCLLVLKSWTHTTHKNSRLDFVYMTERMEFWATL